jgi:ribonucleoside-diphosphate reductase beta chain
MKRFSILPIRHQDLWSRYKAVESQFWRADDGDFSYDNFNQLHQSQKEYLKMLLCFFAVSDSVVSENLALNFLQEDSLPEEAKFFYSYQLVNENIHNETYSKLIDSYIKDENEKFKAFNAATEIPTVSKKMSWALKWITNGTFAEKLIAFIAVEGLLFSSTFAGIFAFKDMKKELPGLYWANAEISRDETSHYEFAVHLYKNYLTDIQKLSPNRIKEIILEAYEVELQFVKDCFSFKPIGLNEDKMIEYIKYVTDTLLHSLNVDIVFGASQPFKYMEQIAIPRRANFFEGRNSEYSSVSNSHILIDTEQDF